jgi:hypothetical protein
VTLTDGGSRALSRGARHAPSAVAHHLARVHGGEVPTLVALAEEKDVARVFTLDADFHVYRVRGRRRFEVVPA